MYLKILEPLAMVHMNEEILQMCDDILVLKMTVLETLNAMMLVVPARSSGPLLLKLPPPGSHLQPRIACAFRRSVVQEASLNRGAWHARPRAVHNVGAQAHEANRDMMFHGDRHQDAPGARLPNCQSTTGSLICETGSASRSLQSIV